MKFCKKPVEIEAFKFYVDEMPNWFLDKVVSNDIILKNCNYDKYGIDEAYCEIKTLEGIMRANGGDYIIKGIQGEIYPFKPDIFEKTYEKVGNRKNKTNILIIGRTLNHAEWKAMDLIGLIGNSTFKMINKYTFENQYMVIHLGSFKCNINKFRGLAMDKILIHKSVTSEQFEILKWTVRGPKDVYYFEE